MFRGVCFLYVWVYWTTVLLLSPYWLTFCQIYFCDSTGEPVCLCCCVSMVLYINRTSVKFSQKWENMRKKFCVFLSKVWNNLKRWAREISRPKKMRFLWQFTPTTDHTEKWYDSFHFFLCFLFVIKNINLKYFFAQPVDLFYVVPGPPTRSVTSFWLVVW